MKGQQPDNCYDKACRYAATIDASGFLGWLNTRGVPFPGDPDRANDSVPGLLVRIVANASSG